MELLLSTLFLVLNLAQYELKMNKYIFTVLGAALFFALFSVVFKKTENVISACLIVMCYTWQSSWINIFGESTSELQLPWFYVAGAIMFLSAAVKFRSCFERTYSGRMVLIFLMMIIWIHFPLFTSESMSEGLKNYVMIMFYLVLLFVSFMFHDTMSAENYEHFKSSLIWSVLLCAVALIFQYIMYRYASVTLFKIEILPSFSSYQIGCRLLMEDHSSATIMFGVAAFYIIERVNKKTWWYYGTALIAVVASMAMTSRRTSTVTFIVVFAVFAMTHYKGFKVKLGLSVLIGVLALIMLYFLLISRPVDSLSQLLDDNGRFENYADALNLIKKNPLGIGLDDISLAYSMENTTMVPHNTFLRWMCFGGIPMGILMLLVVAYPILCAHRKKMSSDFWAILYTVAASNFIPDILCARFFIIICAVPLLTSQFRDGVTYERLYDFKFVRRIKERRKASE